MHRLAFKRKPVKRSTVKSQPPGPGAFKLCQTWTWAKASCFLHGAQPESMAVAKEPQFWGRTGLLKKQSFQWSFPWGQLRFSELHCCVSLTLPNPLAFLLSFTGARTLSQLEGFLWMFLPPLPFYVSQLFFFPVNAFKGLCFPLCVALTFSHRFWYIVFLLSDCVYVTLTFLSLHIHSVIKMSTKVTPWAFWVTSHCSHVWWEGSWLTLQGASLFFFLNFYWRIVDLQCCLSFCCTVKWISYTYTYVQSF